MVEQGVTLGAATPPIDDVTEIIWLLGDTALVRHNLGKEDEWIEAVYPLRAHQLAP